MRPAVGRWRLRGPSLLAPEEKRHSPRPRATAPTAPPCPLCSQPPPNHTSLHLSWLSFCRSLSKVGGEGSPAGWGLESGTPGQEARGPGTSADQTLLRNRQLDAAPPAGPGLVSPQDDGALPTWSQRSHQLHCPLVPGPKDRPCHPCPIPALWDGFPKAPGSCLGPGLVLPAAPLAGEDIVPPRGHAGIGGPHFTRKETEAERSTPATCPQSCEYSNTNPRSSPDVPTVPKCTVWPNKGPSLGM